MKREDEKKRGRNGEGERKRGHSGEGMGFAYLTPMIAEGFTALTASSSLRASPSLESG